MPMTVERYEQSMSAPPLCEQLRIRDLLDDVAVQIDGSMVAGFEVGGISIRITRAMRQETGSRTCSNLW